MTLKILSALAASDKAYAHLEQKVAKLEKVSGKSIDNLIEMFAEGFELVLPPERWPKENALSLLAKEFHNVKPSSSDTAED